jgi:YggT family protein
MPSSVPGPDESRGPDSKRDDRPHESATRPPGAAGAAPVTLVLASTRTDVADFLSTLIYVYTLLIIVYIVIQLLFAVGLRPPYSRTIDAVLGFLRDVCEPFLRIFRRVIPSLGGIDFSPILAIITLQIINGIVVRGVIHG